MGNRRGAITAASSGPFRVSSFKLRNTKNDQSTLNAAVPKDLRSTIGYTIELSPDASTWTTAATGTLIAYDTEVKEIASTLDVGTTKYVKFSITSYSGNGGGLSYFEAFHNDDDTDCSYVVADGGYGTGAFGNICHNDCSSRGICDYATGSCQCFKGFFSENCGSMSTFAGGG